MDVGRPLPLGPLERRSRARILGQSKRWRLDDRPDRCRSRIWPMAMDKPFHRYRWQDNHSRFPFQRKAKHGFDRAKNSELQDRSNRRIRVRPTKESNIHFDTSLAIPPMGQPLMAASTATTRHCSTPLGSPRRRRCIPGMRCAIPGFVVKRLRRGQADDREAVQQHSSGSRSAPRGQGCRLRTEPQRGFNINPKRNVRLFRHRIFYTSGETLPETILSDDVLPDS